MDDILKMKFWNRQKYIETFDSRKYSYRFKAILMTLFPSYVLYYHFYENKIRKYSFLLQFIVIYNLYKYWKYYFISYDIEKENDPSDENNIINS